MIAGEKFGCDRTQLTAVGLQLTVISLPAWRQTTAAAAGGNVTECLVSELKGSRLS